MADDITESSPQNKFTISFNSPFTDEDKSRIREAVSNDLDEIRGKVTYQETEFHQEEYLNKLISEGKINPEKISDFLAKFDIHITPNQIVSRIHVNPQKSKYYELENRHLDKNMPNSTAVGSFNGVTTNIRFHTDTWKSPDQVVIHELTHYQGKIDHYYTAEDEGYHIYFDKAEYNSGLESRIIIHEDETNNLGVFFSEGIAYWMEKQYLVENDPSLVDRQINSEIYSSGIDSLIMVYKATVKNSSLSSRMEELTREIGIDVNDEKALVKLLLLANREPIKYEQTLRSVINTMFSSIDPDFYDTLLMIGREYLGQKPLGNLEIGQFESRLNNLCATLTDYLSTKRIPIANRVFDNYLKKKMQSQLKELRSY